LLLPCGTSLNEQIFQPRYTFDFDWSAPREHVSLATVRSIRNMTSQLPLFQGRFLEIIDQEFQKAMASGSQKEGMVFLSAYACALTVSIGWTHVALWPTVQRAVTRINTLVMFGEETGMSMTSRDSAG
jgi:hypothetical protein